jgi:replication factor C subunit 2/4
MKNRLQDIASKEGCSIEDSHLDSILDLADGDMRRAVTTLQCVHSLGKVDEKIISELAGVPPNAEVEKLVQSLDSNMFESMKEAVEVICAEGYSAQTILGCLLERFVQSNDLDELGRAKLAIRIAEAEQCMIDGADEYLQLMTVCGLAMQCVQSAKTAMETN